MSVRKAKRRVLEATGPVGPLIALAALLLLLASLGSATTDRAAIVMFVTMTVVIGVYVFVGNSGILSFGHIAFMAIGAYTSAILTLPEVQKGTLLPDLPEWLASLQLSTWQGVLSGAGVAMVVAVLIGIPLMRLSGLAAALGTMAFLLAVYIVVGSWATLTRGPRGMVGVPVDTTATRAMIAASIAMIIAYVFQQSRWGLRLRATREDEIAARGVGITVVRERVSAFVLSAGVVAAGGGLFAHFIGSFTANSFYFRTTALTLAMLVIGGIRSLSGAVIGTVVVSALTEFVRRLEVGASLGGVTIDLPAGTQELIVAVLMLTILILRPSGITGGREIGPPLLTVLPARGRDAPIAKPGSASESPSISDPHRSPPPDE